jgi:hypothetical protein
VYISVHIVPRLGWPKSAQVCQSLVQLLKLLQHAKKLLATPSMVQVYPYPQVRGETRCYHIINVAVMYYLLMLGLRVAHLLSWPLTKPQV